MMNEFRELRANEIEARVQSFYLRQENNEKVVYAVILLYKNARADMNVLDETVGITNWKNTHEVIGNNLYCTVYIYDDEKKEWIGKQDVGIESNMQAEKGQASDSFKRACFRWGIGRELYTAPSIFIRLNNNEWNDDRGKVKSNIRFKVSRIDYEGRKIKGLEIIDTQGNVRWSNYKKGE